MADVQLTATGSGFYRVRVGLLALLLAAPLGAQTPPTRVQLDSLRAEVVRVRAFNRSAETTMTRVLARLDSMIARLTVPPTTPPPPPPPDSTPTPPPPPPPPPPSGGSSWYVAWDTCQGVALNCKSDGGRLQVALSDDQYNVGEVVAGTVAGFPSPNALQIRTVAQQSALRLLYNSLPAITEGSSRYTRFYFRLDQPPGGDNNNHPIEANNLQGPISWAFRTNVTSATEWTAQLRLAGASVTIWETPPLRLGVPYRVEYQFERLTGQNFRVHARIYDMAGALVAQDAQWRNIGGGTGTLADSPVISLDTNNLNSISIGLNGISGNPALLYGYQGAFCVRSDTWCGPYVAGEGR